MSEFERLFLLEFFVDTVYVKNSSVEDVKDSTLCVSFKFLYYPVMLVCEEDFVPKTKSLSKGTDVVFKSGKSCLFSLRTDPSTNMPPEFDLTIRVIQNMKESNPPGKSLVGESIVKMGSSFTNLMVNSSASSLPTAYVKQDTFPLKDRDGQHVGNLAAFIRLSCFGKLIVTQFQLADSKNYMFKGTDPKKIFADDENVIRPISSVERHDKESEAEEEIPGDTPYEDIFGYPEECEETEEEQKIDEEEKEHDIEETEKEKDQKVPEAKEKEKEESDPGEKEENYKEIGAEINGNCITIRVLKKGKRAKKQSSKSSEEVLQGQQQSMQPGDAPPQQLCPCLLMPRCLCPPPPPPPPPPRTCPPECPPTCCPPPGCPPSCCEPSSPPPPQCCCPPPFPPSFQQALPPPFQQGLPPPFQQGLPPPFQQALPPPFQQALLPPFQQGLPPLFQQGLPPPFQLPFPPSLNPFSSFGGQQNMGVNPQSPGSNMPQCPREDCPMGLFTTNPQQPLIDLEPGMVAMKGDQVVFQMANHPVGEPLSEKERKLANSIYYKVASGEPGKEGMKNTVQISTQNAGEPLNPGSCIGGGPVSGLPIDNKQDMFLLKVQQNNDGVDAKSKLEMEVRTPKTKEIKPDTSTKNTQYITTDFPAPEKKPAKEKGGKKKKK